MVAAQAARDGAAARGKHAAEANRLHSSLEPLRDQIRAEAPETLARLETAGYPEGRLVRVSRGARMFGKEFETKAGWELERHQEAYKGELVEASTWLLSDGRITGGHGTGLVEVLDQTESEHVLSAILDGLRDLAGKDST